MQVLQSAQDLVQEHLYVVCGQGLRGDDDLMQITLHQLRYHVSDGEKRERKKWISLILDSEPVVAGIIIHMTIPVVAVAVVTVVRPPHDTHISLKKSICGGCRMSTADRTFSWLKKRSILISLMTRFELTRLWNTCGIFFRATLFPSRGSVTDL